uniref:Alpha-1,6-mannosyl-glycoprotein 2-beta-N-acetylglucosaminyltransferase n=1 Tax=Plectus sambesii TaxID=2011161 RepID=A0A914W1C0_9BILA
MSRRYAVRVLKAVFVLSAVSFIAVQLHLRGASPDDEPSGVGAVAAEDVHPQQRVVNGLDKAIVEPAAPVQPVAAADSAREAAAAAGLTASAPSIDEIKSSVDFNNAHSEVLNEDKFGPAADASVVIVVQVHDRVKYLELLVNSLGAAVGIDKALVIFSHDFHSPEINDIIRNIKFCRVLQIFYPYSIQLFPDKFPGQDPADCPSNMPKDEAESKQCKNWNHPDKYGHYRVARLTQIKHHWWWKMNYVFDGIPQLANFGGYTLLLEEDHCVSPDFLHVLDYIIDNKASLCPQCQMIALGFYLKQYGSYGSNIDKLAVYPWFSSRHNMGMALNRDTWTKFRNCSNLFCTYDDYNWDWSLMRVNMECLKERLYVVYTKAPRVFHVGDCGVHNHKCQADSSMKKVMQILSSVKDNLFPTELHVSETSKRMLKPPKENGGWGDIRDHALCKNNTRWPQAILGAITRPVAVV